MFKIAEKLKTLVPTNLYKILFPILLSLSCIFLSFVYINFLNVQNIGLSILAFICIGLLIFTIVESLIIIQPKIFVAPINAPQHFIMYNLLYAIEIFVLGIIHFVCLLISPYVYLIIGLISFISCAYINMEIEYTMYYELTRHKNKFLNSIKIYNIGIICFILIIWVIL